MVYTAKSLGLKCRVLVELVQWRKVADIQMEEIKEGAVELVFAVHSVDFDGEQLQAVMD